MTSTAPDIGSLDIAQVWLDETSACLMNGNFAALREAVALPFVVTTLKATMVQNDEASLKLGFESYCRMLHAMRATQMIRIADAVCRLSEDLLVAAYETNILDGATRVVSPFRSAVTLRCDDGRWVAVSVSSSTSNRVWPIDVLRIEAERSVA